MQETWATRPVHRLNQIGAVVDKDAREAGGDFLDPSAEGVVLEGRRSAVGAGDNGLRQPVLEVPGVGFACGIGDGIAVCVVD